MIFRIAIAILQVSKEELLTLDMEGMLKVCFCSCSKQKIWPITSLLSIGLETQFKNFRPFILKLIAQLIIYRCFQYFQKEMPARCETDPDYLIGLASQVKYNAKQMKK